MPAGPELRRLLDEVEGDLARLLDAPIVRVAHDKIVWSEIACALRYELDGVEVRSLHGEAIATYSPEMGVLHWSWTARSVKAPPKQTIDQAFREGHRLGIPELTAESIQLDAQEEARRVAALAASLAGADGVVEVEDGTRVAFVAVYGVRPGGQGSRPASGGPKSRPGSQRAMDGATEPSRAMRLPPYSVPPSRPTSVPPGSRPATPIPVTTAVPPPLPAPTPPPPTDKRSAPVQGAPSSVRPPVSAPGTGGLVNPFPRRRRSSPASVPREPPREIVLPVAQRVLAALDMASPHFREALFVITADAPGQGGRFGVEVVAISAEGALTSVDPPSEVIDAVGRMLAVDWGGRFQRLVGRLRPGDSSASLDIEVRS